LQAQQILVAVVVAVAKVRLMAQQVEKALSLFARAIAHSLQPRQVHL
jgi:Flp pilus assembly protein TadG